MSCSKAISTTHPHPVRCSHPHPSPSPLISPSRSPSFQPRCPATLFLVASHLSLQINSCLGSVFPFRYIGLRWCRWPVQLTLEKESTVVAKLVEFHVEMTTRNARERKTVKQSPERISRWASSRGRIQKDCRKELILLRKLPKGLTLVLPYQKKLKTMWF